MMFNLSLITAALCLTQAVAGKEFSEYKLDRQRRAIAHFEQLKESSSSGSGKYFYQNANTSSYLIKSMPQVNYDLGEMYGGSIPINNSDPSRQLFFIFKPVINATKPLDEITIYLNGGPGCSSMAAFFQENGPFLWQPGTFLPVPNPYSWANETNMLWVDQPVGTGFSTGKITAKNEVDTAKDFVAWFKNFQQKFGIKNFKIYVTGESYAGRYVPYISAQMLNQQDTKYYNLKGALIYDGVIGDYSYTQEEIMAYPFALKNQAVLNLNSTFMAQMKSLHNSCGYAALIAKYLTFPPPGNQPQQPQLGTQCDIFGDTLNALYTINPCFDIYSVNQQCPFLWDVLSFPTELFYTPAGATTYFDRADVKAAIHAPPNVHWQVCGEHSVFPHGDGSPDPIQHVLPQVIEATNRVLVANGDLDMIIITDGTLMAIQNMTWNGKLGFQQKPAEPIVITMSDLEYATVFQQNGAKGVDGPQGTMGVQHYERGLMWAETYLSGHEGPEFQPRVSLRHLQWVLGRIQTL